MQTFNINEIFYSLQGEGSRIGKPCVFVRFQGCNLRCRWCDTLDALDINTKCKEYSFDDLINKIKSYNCNFIEFTGGEPLIHKGINVLFKALLADNYTVAAETNGSIDISEFEQDLIKIIDIKCPSSEMEKYNNYKNFNYLNSKDEIKFVIASKEDYLFAKNIINSYQLKKITEEIIISPVLGEIEPLSIAEAVLSDNLPVRFQLQLHKIIWGMDSKGV